MGKRPAENTDPNDPLGLRKKLADKTNVLAAETPKQDDPLGLRAKLAKKKEPDGEGSGPTGLDISPAANYRQSLKDYNSKAEELNNLQNDLTGLKSMLDKQDVLQQDPAKVEEFKGLVKQYNEKVNDNNKRVKELQRMEVLLKSAKSSYDEDNKARQDQLFKSLGLTAEEKRELKKQIFKQQFPDRAAEVDAGTFIPDYLEVDAEDLAKSLTGKTLNEVQLQAHIKANRPISDRVFGSFSRSVQKTLAFELPSGVGATISNLMAGAKIRDEDLEKPWYKPEWGGIYKDIKKAISLVPGAKQAVNSNVDDARVATFEWAQKWRENRSLYVPGIGFLQNDPDLIRSISQIQQPLDVIDYIASNAGQGVAQIPMAMLTRGASSAVQEIGNNYLEGVIEISREKNLTPAEVIRRDMDEPVVARNFGIAQAALDMVGANRAMKAIGFDAFKKDLKRRGIRWFEELQKDGGTEFLTEGAQGALQQVSTGKMIGLGNIESVKRINWFQVLDEALAGYVGGTTVGGGKMLAQEARSRMGLFKDIAVKPNKTEEEAEVLGDLFDILVETAKKHGDPRSPAEIKRFIQNDVLNQVEVPKATPPAVTPEPEAVEVAPETVEAPETDTGILKPGTSVEMSVEPTPVNIDEMAERNQVPTTTISDKERLIAEHLKRFPKESWNRFGDPNFIKDMPAMRMSWLGKNGTPLDVQAQEMSLILNPQGDGTDITTDDLVEFVKRFWKGKRQFKSLDAAEAAEMTEEVFSDGTLSDEFFDKHNDLRYALESIDQWGITPENINSQEIQEYLNNSFLFDDADRENINLIFEYAATDEGLQKINSLLADINREVSESFGERPGLSEVQRAAQEADEEVKINREGFPETWGSNAVQNAEDPSLQANPPTKSKPATPPSSKDIIENPQKRLKTKAGHNPNENGVYVSNDVERIEFRKKGWGVPYAEVKFVQLENGKWISATGYFDDLTKTSGWGNPLSLGRGTEEHATKEDAIKAGLQHILGRNISDRVRKWAQSELDKFGPTTKKGSTKPGKIKKSEKVQKEIDDLFGELDDLLKNSLSANINPQAAVIGAKIVAKYVELGVVKFTEIAGDVYANYGEDAFRKFFQSIKAGYGSLLATSDDPNLTSLEDLRKARVEDFITKTQDDDTSTTGDLESDSTRDGSQDQVGQTNVPNDGRTDREGTGTRVQATQQSGNVAQGNQRVSDDISSTGGKRSDTKLDQPTQSTRTAGNATGSLFDTGSTGTNGARPSSGQQGTGSTESTPANQTPVKLSFEEKVRLQERANRTVAIISKDKANIAESMPILLPHQVDNVYKAEVRFFNPPPADGGTNKGMLYTDGTGTGKTFTGLGIMKRFERMGKKSQLIVVPSDAMVKTWIHEGKFFGLNITQLKDTKDAGRDDSIIITTYANFRQNMALPARVARRPFDLVLYDEAHNIISNSKGEKTAADDTHKALTNSPTQAWLKAKAKYATMFNKAYGPDGTYEQRKRVDELITAEQKRLIEATKVVFLSATPFAYHKSLEYADGYLFNITEGIVNGGASDSYNNFYIKNFGYRYRQGSLNEPDKSVNISLMERAFHTQLTKMGVISSTRLKLDKDYSREFVLVDDKAGMMIDEGIRIMSDGEKYKYLPHIIGRKFSWHYRMQVLESIKAKRSIERIRKHLELGRKVVIFHGFNNSLPSHPFDFSDPIYYPPDIPVRLVQAEIDSFNKEYPEYHKMDMRDLTNPITTIKRAFGEEKVLVFNGEVPTKKRNEAKLLFNKDGSGYDIIVCQMKAAREGLSLHDTTGKSQRVVMNLGLPIAPTESIQTEGRIYRIGQQSDAIIEYPVLHLNFEKWTFAEKINERAGTVENLAFGEGARNLREAFKEGYKAPITDDPHLNQGKGNRDGDLRFEAMDPWEMAKTLYYGRQKRNSKTKAREGVDYYATPEPVGLKIAEWLYAKDNHRLLEPSAGHGAIGRYFPENTVNKFIEPSDNLRGDLSINVTGEVMGITFESLHVGANKFEGIAMNPPFGSSGKTAMEHFEKGLKHLTNGGRLIAVLPDGPSMQTRLDKWIESEDSKNFFVTAKIKLPSVTFERAGTSVRTQILVVDKQEVSEIQEQMPLQRNMDFSNIEDINELFDKLKDLDMPARLKPTTLATATSNVNNTFEKPIPAKPDETSTVIAGKHTRKGHDIWTVKLLKHIDATDFKKAFNRTRALGGRYNRFRGDGAIPGFLFEGPMGAENANKVSDYINSGFIDNDFDPSDPSGGRSSYMPMGSPAKGRSTMGAYGAKTITNSTGEAFKLYQKVIDLAARYNPNGTIGQGHQGKGNWGVFFNKSRNVRVAGLNNLSVAMHELVHALDARNNVIKNLIDNTKSGAKVRERITELYLQYYPGAKPNHDLRTRMVEGYAMMVQKFIEAPNAIKRDFPDLVREFLTAGGKYWTDEVGLFVNDVTEIIAQYQAMNPLEKIGSRVTNEVINPPDKKFLTSADKITTEIFDKLHPIEKLAKVGGTHFTQDDISLWMRLSNNWSQIAMKNISSTKQRFWNMDSNGQWSEKHKFNYHTLVKSLDRRGLQEEFAAYLVARRLKFEYDELNDLNNNLSDIMSPKYLSDLMNTMKISQEAATKIQSAHAEDVQKEIKRLAGILENEGIEENEANEAYDAGKDVFKEEESMYDTLVAEDLEFAHNPLVQLLDEDGYQKFTNRKGYATFKRAFYDELVGDQGAPAIQTAGKTKVSQFLTRRGSEKPVLNPLIGAMMNHTEIIRKGMRQMVHNKFLQEAEKHPELFQILPLEVNQDSSNRYPQEKNPDILMARKNYKRVPILVDRQIKRVIDENYDYHNAHLLERSLITASQMFRTGTTGIFWQFFMNNTLLDQIAAFVNTRNGLIPFISSILQISPALLMKNSKEAAYLKEYLFLAGTSQTFLSADIESVKQIEDIIKGEDKKFIKRANNLFENIAKILSAPGNATEIMTRGTEYIMARKAGKPQQVALEEAGRVSAPFHHMGRLNPFNDKTSHVGQSYIRTVAYFNASLQVLKQTQNTLNTKEGRIRFAFTAVSMAAAAVGSTLYMLSDDEDDRELLLSTLPPDSMTKYLYLPNPYSKKRLIQIRIPEQVGFLAGIMNMMLLDSKKVTNYKWSEYGEAAMSFGPTQFNPFNPTQALYSYIPQGIKPGVETMMGQKVYPSVRPIETTRDKTLPPELRYNQYTTPGAKMIGEALGWSPKVIDNFLHGQFGRAYKYLFDPKKIFNAGDLFNREMYLEASRQVQFFYETRTRVMQNIKAYNDGLKEYPMEEVNKLFNLENHILEIESLLDNYHELQGNDLLEPQSIYTRNMIFKRIQELEAAADD